MEASYRASLLWSQHSAQWRLQKSAAAVLSRTVLNAFMWSTSLELEGLVLSTSALSLLVLLLTGAEALSDAPRGAAVLTFRRLRVGGAWSDALASRAAACLSAALRGDSSFFASPVLADVWRVVAAGFGVVLVGRLRPLDAASIVALACALLRGDVLLAPVRAHSVTSGEYVGA